MYLVITRDMLTDLQRYALYGSPDLDDAVSAAQDNANEDEDVLVIDASVLHLQGRQTHNFSEAPFDLSAELDFPFTLMGHKGKNHAL